MSTYIYEWVYRYEKRNIEKEKKRNHRTRRILYYYWLSAILKPALDIYLSVYILEYYVRICPAGWGNVQQTNHLSCFFTNKVRKKTYIKFETISYF